MMIRRDELDLNPPGGSAYKPPSVTTRDERLKAHEAAVTKARAALAETTDEHLAAPWRLLVAGKVVSEQPRYAVLRDTFMHLAHHRAQLTGTCGCSISRCRRCMGRRRMRTGLTEG